MEIKLHEFIERKIVAGVKTARGGNLFIFQEGDQCFLDPVTEVYELLHNRMLFGGLHTT